MISEIAAVVSVSCACVAAGGLLASRRSRGGAGYRTDLSHLPPQQAIPTWGRAPAESDREGKSHPMQVGGEARPTSVGLPRGGGAVKRETQEPIPTTSGRLWGWQPEFVATRVPRSWLVPDRNTCAGVRSPRPTTRRGGGLRVRAVSTRQRLRLAHQFQWSSDYVELIYSDPGSLR